MVEGGALEVSEADVLEALTVAQKGISELIGCQEELLSKAGRAPKMEWTKAEAPEGSGDAREGARARAKISDALNQKDKHTRIEAVERAKKEVADAAARRLPGRREGHRTRCSATSSTTRSARRCSRPACASTAASRTRCARSRSTPALLPRAHGSALFTRGQTQALVAATLGTADDVQRLDSIDDAGETTKSFMLHYNFPPFSTGEVRPMRGTSRREIGHGNLAERALQGVLPPFEEFPYTIRIVSDILESNGSSSMASVCGGSLALFDAGVPMRAAVAGVAMGLIKEGSKYAILTDILGTEDHLGDMDFKVAGTRDGITSIQMDIKIEGLDLDDHEGGARPGARRAAAHPRRDEEGAGRAARGPVAVRAAHRDGADQPREDRRSHRTEGQDDPRHPGRDGRRDHGRRYRHGDDRRGWRRGDGARAPDGAGDHGRSRSSARRTKGTVKSTTAFGAFIEIMPGTEALLHISEMRHGRTEKTEDVVKKGDRVKVKLIDRDERGRLRLSMKALHAEARRRHRRGCGKRRRSRGVTVEPAVVAASGRRARPSAQRRRRRRAVVRASAAEGAEVGWRPSERSRRPRVAVVGRGRR